MTPKTAALLVVLLVCPAALHAQEAASQVTVRATRLSQPLVIDGRLDEAVYATLEPTPPFRQQEPQVGELAT